jgi:hypothetical protein
VPDGAHGVGGRRTVVEGRAHQSMVTPRPRPGRIDSGVTSITPLRALPASR